MVKIEIRWSLSYLLRSGNSVCYTSSNFAGVLFGADSTHAQSYAALDPFAQRFTAPPDDERHDVCGQVTVYIHLYAFLARMITLLDTDLYELYVFARDSAGCSGLTENSCLLKSNKVSTWNPTVSSRLLAEELRWNEMETKLDPVRTKDPRQRTPEELKALSLIIADLNERFGIELSPEHRITLSWMMERLVEDSALEIATKVNTLENARITFDHKVEQVIQEIIDLDFNLYKRITDDPAFGEAMKNHLFDQ